MALDVRTRRELATSHSATFCDNSNRNLMDQSFQSFLSEATDPYALFSMLVGNIAYRTVKLGALTFGAQRIRSTGSTVGSWSWQLFSSALGLSSETFAFEGSRRFLQMKFGGADADLLRWDGSQGLKVGLMHSALNLGVMKGVAAGGAAVNPLLRHASSNLAILGMHQAAALFKLEDAPPGDFIQQLAWAEIVQWQWTAGQGLLNGLAPWLLARQEAANLSSRALAKIRPFAAKAPRSASFLPERFGMASKAPNPENAGGLKWLRTHLGDDLLIALECHPLLKAPLRLLDNSKDKSDLVLTAAKLIKKLRHFPKTLDETASIYASHAAGQQALRESRGFQEPTWRAAAADLQLINLFLERLGRLDPFIKASVYGVLNDKPQDFHRELNRTLSRLSNRIQTPGVEPADSYLEALLRLKDDYKAGNIAAITFWGKLLPSKTFQYPTAGIAAFFTEIGLYNMLNGRRAGQSALWISGRMKPADFSQESIETRFWEFLNEEEGGEIEQSICPPALVSQYKRLSLVQWGLDAVMAGGLWRHYLRRPARGMLEGPSIPLHIPQELDAASRAGNADDLGFWMGRLAQAYHLSASAALAGHARQIASAEPLILGFQDVLRFGQSFGGQSPPFNHRFQETLELQGFGPESKRWAARSLASVRERRSELSKELSGLLLSTSDAAFMDMALQEKISYLEQLQPLVELLRTPSHLKLKERLTRQLERLKRGNEDEVSDWARTFWADSLHEDCLNCSAQEYPMRRDATRMILPPMPEAPGDSGRNSTLQGEGGKRPSM